MKKILFISNRTSFSGGEVVLVRLIENDKQIEPVVAAPKGEFAQRIKELDVKVHVLNEISQLNRRKNKFWPIKAMQNSIQGQLRIYKIIKEESPDIVQANALGAAIYSFLPCWINRNPFIWTSHNIYSKRSLNSLAVRIVGLFSKKVIAVSKAVQDNLTQAGISKKKTEVIYNGLEITKETPSGDSLRKKFELPKDTTIIALIAAITPWKGQEILIDAAARVVNEFPNIAIFIIGEVEDPEYQEQLIKKVKNLNLSRFIFFTGFIKEITTVYPQIDILVNTSIEPEPFGTTIYESMARGIITVGSDIGGTPEIIDNDKTGYLFKPGDSESLATKLSFIMSQSGKLDVMRASARQSVAELFSIRSMVDHYNNLYENL